MMALRLKAMLERKATLATEIKRQADMLHADGKTRDFTAEETPAWEKLNADYDANERLIAVEQRASSVSGGFAPPPKTEVGGYEKPDIASRDRDYSLALAAWMGKYADDFEITDAHIDAAKRVGFKLDAKSVPIPLASTEQYESFRRRFNAATFAERENLSISAGTMTVGTASAGGSLVPPGVLLNSLEWNMLFFDSVRQVAETIRTATGEALQWPTADDTGNVGEQLGEEASMSGTAASTSPTVALIPLIAYKISSKPIKLSSELLQDSQFNMLERLPSMLGERIGRFTNTRYTTGTGTSQAQGIVTGSAVGKTAASSTAFTADELIDLFHSVDIAYRNSASWMMHDTIVAYIRKFKDSTGQYIWQSGLQAGRPDLLLGRTVNVNNDMDSALTTGKKLVLFGQLNKFKIRAAGPARFIHLSELYRDNDQDGFVVFLREDARVLNAGTNPIKRLVLA